MDDEDEEQETEAIVNQVLDEIGITLSSEVCFSSLCRFVFFLVYDISQWRIEFTLDEFDCLVG